MFYLQPGVEYLGAGENGTMALNMEAITLVYFKAYFSEAESEFFGQLGPRFGFAMNQTIKNPSKPIYTTDTIWKDSSF
jgi:hypothetical protein